MRKIEEIILHHSAFAASDNARKDFDKIKVFHLSKGWKDIGYHYVICSDGQVFVGRHLDKVGAHCKGHNRFSVGICLIGDFTNHIPTIYQLHSLDILVRDLRVEYPNIPVFPHNHYSNTICPGNFLTNYCKLFY